MEYEYNKKEINLKQFIEEMELDLGFKTKGNKICFIFENSLSSSDKTKLDNAVVSHVSQPIIKPPKTPAEEKLSQIRGILKL